MAHIIPAANGGGGDVWLAAIRPALPEAPGLFHQLFAATS